MINLFCLKVESESGNKKSKTYKVVLDWYKTVLDRFLYELEQKNIEIFQSLQKQINLRERFKWINEQVKKEKTVEKRKV
jgi:hypothetical protein